MPSMVTSSGWASVLLFALASIRLDWLSSADQRSDHDPGHP